MIYRVLVDESGDRGIAAGSSAHFVTSAIIVADGDTGQARQALDQLRLDLGRHSGHVLHFRNLNHSQKVKATQDIAGFPIAAIACSIVCKRTLGQPTSAGNMAYISRPDPMYLWALRLLLERISWYARDNGGAEAIVTFAHVRRFKVQKLHDYRQALRQSQTEIWWPAFDGHPFRVSDHGATELLQLADISASALFKAIEPDTLGIAENRYLRNLSPKLYRRGGGALTSYGLKVFPASEANSGGSLHWLRGV